MIDTFLIIVRKILFSQLIITLDFINILLISIDNCWSKISIYKFIIYFQITNVRALQFHHELLVLSRIHILVLLLLLIYLYLKMIQGLHAWLNIRLVSLLHLIVTGITSLNDVMRILILTNKIIILIISLSWGNILLLS